MSDETRKILDKYACNCYRALLVGDAEDRPSLHWFRPSVVRALLDTIDELRMQLAVAEAAIARIEFPSGPVVEPPEPSGVERIWEGLP